MKYIAIILLITSCSIKLTSAQCCSMGNPSSSFSAADKATEPGQLVVNYFFKYGYNETYFRKNVKLINYGMYNFSEYNFSGLTAYYRINKRYQAGIETGYYFNKSVDFADPVLEARSKNGFGLSNSNVSVLYDLIRMTDSTPGIIISAGFKFPFSFNHQNISNVELPIELQPSTNAFGFNGSIALQKKVFKKYMLSLMHKSEFNLRNKYNYLYGSMHISSISITGPISKKIHAGIALRNELKMSDKTPTGALLASQGSNLLLISPRLEYYLFKKLSIYVNADLPVYKYYFGEQISIKYAVSSGIMARF